MITDEEIKLAAMRTGFTVPDDAFVATCLTKDTVQAFAREIERISRKHQRESDAALCDEFSTIEGIAQMCAKAIRANTGELK